MNAKRTLRRWVKSALRPKPGRKPPSSVSIICNAVPLLIKTYKRLIKICPLLFDQALIDATLAKHLDEPLLKGSHGGRTHPSPPLEDEGLRDFRRWGSVGRNAQQVQAERPSAWARASHWSSIALKRLDNVQSAAELHALAHTSGPPPASKPKLPQDLSTEAWNCLAREERQEIRVLWPLCHRIWEVIWSAQQGIREQQLAGELDFFDGLRLVHVIVALERFRIHCAPAFPAALPGESEQPSVPSEALPGAADEKIINLMARVQAWRTHLHLEQAA
jgi:hypothetical protein